MIETRKDFVELGRRFRELKFEAKTEETALESYTQDSPAFEERFDWKDLLVRRHVVILGEPGSGKTWELEQRAVVLRGQGHFALFVRLDQLGTQPFDAALRQDERNAFRIWLTGGDEGTFFLDSVDEAKFRNVSDFRAALDKVADAIRTGNLDRTRIILSSRITEWQAVSDAHEFALRFPQPRRVRRMGDNETESEEAGKLLVVHLEPLDRAQVRTFAVERGVSDVEAFIQALDKTHAWEFARRPLDVAGLAEFWTQRGRLGCLTELVESDIESKLRPRIDREDLTLSAADAREGAQWLAAASAFSRRFTFLVPEDLPAGTDALDTRKCVPQSWSDEKLRALCNRPIFDGASYGSFRFHHRRVSEYLAAAWLADRMREGCPEEELRRLLFDNVRGRKVLRPSLAPLTAWLCNGNERWNQLVRFWVADASPGLPLRYGDASQLSIDYKRQILGALARMSRDRRRIWLTTSHECLSRLADPLLAPEISALIRDRGLAFDLRIEMVDIVRHGRIEACLDALISVLADPAECEELQIHAASAIGSLRDGATCARLANIARSSTKLSYRLCAEVIKALFPTWIRGGEVATLLKKTRVVKKNATDLALRIRSHFEDALTAQNAVELLTSLVTLMDQPPFATNRNNPSRTLPVSDEFLWIGQLLPTIVTVLLAKPSLTADEVHAMAFALFLIGCAHQCCRERHRDLDALTTATMRHRAVRQACFWILAQDYRLRCREEPAEGVQVFNHWAVLRLAPADLDWLLTDICDRTDENDRQLALRVALEAWIQKGRPKKALREIRRRSQADKQLEEICRTTVATVRFFRLKHLWRKHVSPTLAEPWWWHVHLQRVMWWWQRFRAQVAILWRMKAIASGQAAGWLVGLAHEADEQNSSSWTPSTWSGLEEKRGKWITKAARRGCKVSWRGFTPPLPHERADLRRTQNGVIIGLAGLQAAVEDGELEFPRLTADEANLAARYGVNELNGFAPWLPDLASAHPQSVRDVLNECIRGEWAYPADRADVHDVLQRLVWHGKPFLPLVCGTVLDLITAGDPPNAEILRSTLALLVQQSSPPVQELAQIAGQRAFGPANQQWNPLWFAIWLQVDAIPALARLLQILTPTPQADKFILEVCAWLRGQRGDQYPLIRQPDYLKPEALQCFIPVVHRHVRFEDDLDRSGSTYTPEARDSAQEFRGILLDLLSRSEDPKATETLRLLADDPALRAVRDWVLKLLEDRLEREADMLPWGANDLRAFAKQHETDPKNDGELFFIACKRIRELKFNVEESDNSLRDELHPGSKEIHFRRWLARKLNERSRDRYTVPQEPEIDLQQRPDLRFLRPEMGPVSVEAKLADLGWTIDNLLERLENQLVGQYLRDHQSRYGIYVIGFLGLQQHWIDPVSGSKVSFTEVIELLTVRAKQIVDKNQRLGDVAVIGIDFSESNRV